MTISYWARLGDALDAFERADTLHRAALAAFVTCAQCGRDVAGAQKAAEAARADREVAAHLLAQWAREVAAMHETDALLLGLDTQPSAERPQ
jgi:hypothetical protein